MRHGTRVLAEAEAKGSSTQYAAYYWGYSGIGAGTRSYDLPGLNNDIGKAVVAAATIDAVNAVRAKLDAQLQAQRL